jgi:hypothetical protein
MMGALFHGGADLQNGPASKSSMWDLDRAGVCGPGAEILEQAGS